MSKKSSLKSIYESINICSINIEDKYIEYNGKKYKENEWLRKINSFKVLNEKQVKLQDWEINELPSTILSFFQRNVFKFTFLGLIFPCIVFLVISLISLSVGLILQMGANFEFFKKMLIFLSIVYFFVSLVLFIKIVSGEKVYLCNIGNQARQRHIDKKTYQKYVQNLSKLSTNEAYYFKPISDNGFVLREIYEKDVNSLYNVFKNPLVFRYLLGNEFKSEEDSMKYVENCIKEYKNRAQIKVGIELNGTLIGYIGLSRMDYTYDTCQIIYAIGQEYWGNGYVSKAISMFIPWLESIGKQNIIAGHVKENINSGKVLLKSGFIRYEEKDYILNIHGIDKEILSYIYKKSENN